MLNIFVGYVDYIFVNLILFECRFLEKLKFLLFIEWDVVNIWDKILFGYGNGDICSIEVGEGGF